MQPLRTLSLAAILSLAHASDLTDYMRKQADLRVGNASGIDYGTKVKPPKGYNLAIVIYNSAQNLIMFSYEKDDEKYVIVDKNAREQCYGGLRETAKGAKRLECTQTMRRHYANALAEIHSRMKAKK
jgi:hypothetical protein